MSKPATLVALTGLLGLIVLLAGCQQVGKLPFVYRLDIQQGNVLTEHMLARLQKGMSKKQVRFILGTPLLADTFDDERWDYFYSFRKGGGKGVQRRISLYFENDALDRIEGDVTAPRQREQLVEVPKFKREAGFLAALKPGFIKDESEKRVVVERAEDGTPIGIRKEEGFIAALTPSFLKDDKPVEKAVGQQAGQASAKTAQGGVQAGATGGSAQTTADAKAPESSAPPPPSSSEEEAFLTDVLRGYGRDDNAAPGASKTPSTSSATPLLDAKTKAEEEEAGFFKNMVERYKAWEKESAAASRDIPLPDSNPGQSEN